MLIIVAFDLLLICLTLFAIKRSFVLWNSASGSRVYIVVTLPDFWFMWEVSKWSLFIRAIPELISSGCCSGIYIAYALSCVMERVRMAQPISGSSPDTGVF